MSAEPVLLACALLSMASLGALFALASALGAV